MRHAIYPEKQGTPTTTSEDADYPVTNLLTDYRKQVWKAVSSVQTATLTVPISAGSGVIAIYGTNATSGFITVDGGSLVRTAITITKGRYWQEYTYNAASCVATVEITTTATTLECGIVRAGVLLEMTNPAYGISESLMDHSIKKELRNGAYYTKKLEMNRLLSWQCLMDRETDYRELMTLYEYYGPDPFAMLITDKTGNNDIWTVFGSFKTVPSANHGTPCYSSISISIEEAV